MTLSAPPAALAQRVYALLCDQKFHSGAALAAECGVSRSAVWKTMAALRRLDVTVNAVARRGYRLPHATPPLDAGRIRAALPPEVAGSLRTAVSAWSTGSTNADLLSHGDLPPGRFDFMTAEYQSAGRGRRTRSWFAPPGGSICLSVAWSFASVPAIVGALSLAMGVCALRALRQCGIDGVALKWPNDLVARQAKLGGILAELRAEAAGPAFVVIGIGLNVSLGAAVIERVRASGTHAVDLAELAGAPVDRNIVAAALITRIVEGLQQFERRGFGSFVTEWSSLDALAGKPVQVKLDSGIVCGHARGIDADGALCVQTKDGVQRFTTGDASVRPAT
ncbi:MAG: biotin--[acetyl-CoA-carboxylase] ligase [Steroidobacteraceae bacterium]